MDLSKFITPQIGASGLVILVVLMLFWGKLVTRSQLEDVRADRDARLAEKDAQIAQWREAYALERTARLESMQQVSAMLEVARTTEAVISAIPAAAAIEGGSGASTVAQG